jgi:hypothetical protein
MFVCHIVSCLVIGLICRHQQKSRHLYTTTASLPVSPKARDSNNATRMRWSVSLRRSISREWRKALSSPGLCREGHVLSHCCRLVENVICSLVEPLECNLGVREALRCRRLVQIEHLLEILFYTFAKTIALGQVELQHGICARVCVWVSIDVHIVEIGRWREREHQTKSSHMQEERTCIVTTNNRIKRMKSHAPAQGGSLRWLRDGGTSHTWRGPVERPGRACTCIPACSVQACLRVERRAQTT